MLTLLLIASCSNNGSHPLPSVPPAEQPAENAMGVDSAVAAPTTESSAPVPDAVPTTKDQPSTAPASGAGEQNTGGQAKDKAH